MIPTSDKKEELYIHAQLKAQKQDQTEDQGKDEPHSPSARWLAIPKIKTDDADRQTWNHLHTQTQGRGPR